MLARAVAWAAFFNFVAFAVFKDKAFNGQVFYSHSSDGGRSFAAPVPITANPESQRFEATTKQSPRAVVLSP